MNLPTTLDDWLAHAERQHAQTIAMGLDRVKMVHECMGLAFDCPVITVAGTNGKGSTCAMLESILREAGYRVGVYTSPHLVRFEERCRIDGAPVDGQTLLEDFAAVEAARGAVPLTYFEFTTLAILRRLAREGLDAVVLEVGLGGRLDAVNIIDADCAVITSIDLDHMELLGPDRESIGREKAGIMRAGRPVVVSDPMPPASIAEHAQAIGAELRLMGRDFNYSGDKQQWGWGGRQQRYAGLAYPALRGANQLLNASGVLAALEALRPRLPVTAQAVRVGLARAELPGRFQIVPGQPTLILDVAHNPHAAATLAHNLDQMGFYPRTHVVFGAMADKDIAQVVQRLLPLVDAWYLCDLPTPRAASAAQLSEQLQQALAQARSAGRTLPPQVAASVHDGPVAALQAAITAADPTDRIVVFGSFYTVGGVLAHGIPRLDAPHLGS
ncbi:MAG: bifunctional tetrahydrofolate synthase/dihydrofolate synthase [Pseudomonadota bacterium]